MLPEIKKMSLKIKGGLKWQSKNVRNVEKYGVDGPSRISARIVVVNWKN